MLERTDAIMNEVLEPVAFVLAYPTVSVPTPSTVGYHITINIAIKTVKVKILCQG